MQWLPAEDSAALSGCNRQLRAFFHSITSTILLSKESHIATLKRDDWPSLDAVVVVGTKGGLPKLQQEYGGWLLQAARLFGSSRYHVRQALKLVWAAVFMVRPQQIQEELLRHSQQLSTALLQLRQPQFQLCVVSQFVVPTWMHATWQVTPDWKMLDTLCLSSTTLDASTIFSLAGGDWPWLSQLDLSMCGLDRPAMTELIHGQWPNLECLNLSANPLLDGAVISELAFASWPMLRHVQLGCMLVTSGSFNWLLHKQWANLLHLDLDSVHPLCMSWHTHAHLSLTP